MGNQVTDTNGAMTVKSPLWQAMMESLEGVPNGTQIKSVDHLARLCTAAEIRAVADRITPEEPEPVKPDDVEDGMGWPEWYAWLERKHIRRFLLDEASKAEAGDSPY